MKIFLKNRMGMNMKRYFAGFAFLVMLTLCLVSCPDEKVPGWLQGSWDVYLTIDYTTPEANTRFEIAENKIEFRKGAETIDYMKDVKDWRASVTTNNASEYVITGNDNADYGEIKFSNLKSESGDKVKFLETTGSKSVEYYLKKK